MSGFNNDAPRSWRCPPFFDYYLRPSSRSPRTPANFTHLSVTASARRPIGPVRVAPWPAYYDFLLASHCCSRSSTSEASALGESVQKPYYQQEASDTAQNNSRHRSGFWSREVVVGRYYAFLDCHLLPLGDRLWAGRIEGNCRVVDGWLSRAQAGVGGIPGRKAVELRSNGLVRIRHGGHDAVR
jgi:hypothetical protein